MCMFLCNNLAPNRFLSLSNASLNIVFISKRLLSTISLVLKRLLSDDFFLLLLIEMFVSYNKELKKFISDTRKLVIRPSVTVIDYARSSMRK